MPLAQTEKRSSQDLFILWGVGFSLIVHVLLFLALGSHVQAPPPQPLMVDLVMEDLGAKAPPHQKSVSTQIVSPSAASNIPPPPESRFLSERDSGVAKEQIKHGDQPDAGVPGAQKSVDVKAEQKPRPESAKETQPVEPRRQSPRESAPKTTREKQEPKSPRDVKAEKSRGEKAAPLEGHEDAFPLPRAERGELPGRGAPHHPLKQLLLDESTTIAKFGNRPSPQSGQNLEQSARAARPDAGGYQTFSRPPGSGAKFLGASGVPDYLPNLPDGDITLLNAKANLFAVFVRRVASQVFGALRTVGWETMSGGEIARIANFSTVEAVLSPTGDLLKISLVESSGSSRFDDVLSEAARRGAKDRNPPKGAAASDGNIHFIFKARSWVDVGTGRGGGPFERRWILLGTGLD